jgi:hypothetical protein
MFLRILNWLLKCFGLSLNKNKEKDSPEILDGCDNLIEVDFSRGQQIVQVCVNPTEADQTNETLRAVLTMSPSVHSRMNTLKRMTRVKSHKETVLRALKLYDVLVQLHFEEREVGFYDQDDDWVEIDLEFDQ